MNYTIISHRIDDYRYSYNTCNYSGKEGFLNIICYQDDQDSFIKEWAKIQHANEHDDLIIMFNGISYNEMNDEEYAEYERLEELMNAELLILKEESERIERATREALAVAAEEKARLLAKIQREQDMQELSRLKKKLGV